MLRSRTLASVFWSFVTTWGEQVITLALLVVLARLLSPSEFGIVALAGLAIFILQDIIRVTVNQTLVQMKEVDEDHFATVFWIIISFAIVVSTALVFTAPWIAALFDEAILADIVPWMSIVLVCSACEIVQEARLIRHLNFRPLAVRSLSAAGISGSVALTMAFHGYGVWSMVVQQIIYAIVMLSVTWYFARWMPPFRLSWSHFVEVARFGRYITGMSIVEFIYNRIDVMLIGSFLGTQAVGLYNVGLRILKMLLNGIAGAIVRATLPALSQLQSEPERQRSAFIHCLRLSSVVTIPIFVGLACVAEEAVIVVLGYKWIDAVPVVTLLALAGAMQSNGLLTSTTLIACGKVRRLFYLTLAYAVVYLGSMLIGVQWGVVGIAWALLITIYVMDSIQFFMLSRVLDMRARDLLGTLMPMIAAASVMAATILAFKEFVIMSPFTALPVMVTLGVFSYGLTLALIAPRLRGDVAVLFGEVVKRRAAVTES